MSNFDDEHDEPLVLETADNPLIPNPVSPKILVLLSNQRFSYPAWIFSAYNSFTKEVAYKQGIVSVDFPSRLSAFASTSTIQRKP